MALHGEGFIEYEAPNDEPWRIERGSDLCSFFGIGGAETDEFEKLQTLKRWHAVMMLQGNVWLVLCRLYCIAPLFGVEDSDELRVWTPDEISKKFGMPLEQIGDLENAAKMLWKRQCLAESRMETVEEDLPEQEILDIETVSKILKRYGFPDDLDEAESRFIAVRCMELQAFLDDPHTKAGCRSAIQQDAHIMFVIDDAIRSVRHSIKQLKASNHDPKGKNDELLKLIKARSDAQGAVEQTMSSLGLNEVQTSSLRKKKQFLDSLSGLLDAYKAYYAEENSALLDGFATGAEIELLTTEYDIREAQYRPDLVLLIPHHMRGLWDKEYIPPVISRKAHRRLLAGFDQGLSMARGANGEEILVLDESNREGEIDESERSPDRGVSGGLQAQSNITPQQPIPASPPPRRNRGDELATM